MSTASTHARPVATVGRQIGQAFLWLRPDGWQARSRRNAWASMVADRQHRQRYLIQRAPVADVLEATERVAGVIPAGVPGA